MKDYVRRYKTNASFDIHSGRQKNADCTPISNCLTPFAELPKKPFGKFGKFPEKTVFSTHGDFSCEFEIKLPENNKEEIKTIQELLSKDVERQLSEFYAKVEKIVENIMRNYVTPPIKGEITKGKIRWRGLQMVWQKTDTYDAFVGIRQRDWLIFPDGKKIHWDSLVNIDDDRPQ